MLNENYFLLHVVTSAGTYVKEFVHGDFGRTEPNLGSLLGCTCEIVQVGSHTRIAFYSVCYCYCDADSDCYCLIVYRHYDSLTLT